MLILMIGVFGLLLILAAFGAAEFGLVRQKGFAYNLMNLSGAVFLGMYAYVLENPVFVALEIIWAAIALYFLGKLFLKRKSS